MILTSQFWDFISVFVYALVIMLTILVTIVDLLILWCFWEIVRQWFKRMFKKKDVRMNDDVKATAYTQISQWSDCSYDDLVKTRDALGDDPLAETFNRRLKRL